MYRLAKLFHCLDVMPVHFKGPGLMETRRDKGVAFVDRLLGCLGQVSLGVLVRRRSELVLPAVDVATSILHFGNLPSIRSAMKRPKNHCVVHLRRPKPEWIAVGNRIAAGICIQIDAAREPDRILRQKTP